MSTKKLLFVGSIVYVLFVLSGCGDFRGPTGNTGLTGGTGQPGADGISPTPIQLCSTCTPSYPSTFPEVVFCYSGNLYGTYSANGGFSSELPPGQYSSDGVNCSCTVTIGPNCQVSQ